MIGIKFLLALAAMVGVLSILRVAFGGGA